MRPAPLSDSIFALYATGQRRGALALFDGPRPDLLPWQAELAASGFRLQVVPEMGHHFPKRLATVLESAQRQ